MSYKCPTCDNTGKVHSHNDKCWDCNGTGFIENKNKYEEAMRPIYEYRAMLKSWGNQNEYQHN